MSTTLTPDLARKATPICDFLWDNKILITLTVAGIATAAFGGMALLGVIHLGSAAGYVFAGGLAGSAVASIIMFCRSYCTQQPDQAKSQPKTEDADEDQGEDNSMNLKAIAYYYKRMRLSKKKDAHPVVKDWLAFLARR